MAVVVVAFDGTRVDAVNSTTGWTSANSAETDFYYQGGTCVVDQIKTTRNTMHYTAGSTVDYTPGTGTRRIFLCKMIVTNWGGIDGNGAEIHLGADSTNTYEWRVFSSTTYPREGGWQVVAIDPNDAYGGDTRYTNGSPGLTAIDTYLFACDANATAKAPNFGIDSIDYIDHGTGLTLTRGDSTDADGTFQDFSDDDYGDGQGSGTTGGYGIVVEKAGIFFVSGVLTIGESATATEFTDSNQVLVFPEHRVYTGFCGVDFDIQNASTDITIDGCVFNGRGQARTSPTHDTRPDYEVIGTSGAVSVTGCTFNGYRLITLTAPAVFTGNTFIGGGESMVVADADISGSVFSGFTGAADDSYLDWNVATDPDGELDDLTFTKGTNAHHALELGANTPTTITLNNWDVTGFNASNGQNDSVIFNDSAKAITINVVGATGTISYKNGTSATTTISVSVSLSITVKDAAGAAIQNVYVAIYNASTDAEIMAPTLTNASGVATGSYGGSTPVTVYVRARKSTTGTRYYPVEQSAEITASGLTATYTMVEDIIVS